MYVIEGTSTSSPGPTPNAAKAKWRAVVPFDVPRAKGQSQAAANSASKRSRYGPDEEIQLLATASAA